MGQNEIKLNSSRSWMQFIIVFLVGITIASGMFKVPVNMPNIMEFYGVPISSAGRAVLFDGCNYRPLLFSNPLFRGLFHF